MGVRMKVTCADIAEHFGINKSTVSRALSGKGSMKEETRQRIIEYASEMNYTGATVLGHPRTYNIGVVLPRNLLHFSQYFYVCLTGIVEAAAESSYNVILILEEENRTEAIAKLVERKKCDGYILLQTYPEDRQTAYFSGKNEPVVAIGSVNDDSYQLDSDTRLGSKELTAHLIHSGSRKIGYIGGRSSYVVNRRRYGGYEQACMENLRSVDRSTVCLDIITKEDTKRAVEELLTNGCDAIVCGDDILAIQVLDQLTCAGVHVPEEIRLASCFDSTYTEQARPPVTAVNVKPQELGFRAGELLLDLIAGKPVKKKTRIEYRIFYRKSTER